MAGNTNMAYKIYKTVIEDVIANVRETFMDDGVDEQVLQELKLTWEKRLAETKTVEQNAKETDTASAPTTTSGGRRGNRDQAGGSQRAKAAAAAQLQAAAAAAAQAAATPVIQNQQQTPSAVEQQPQPVQQQQTPQQPLTQSVVRQTPAVALPQQQMQAQQVQVVLDQNGRLINVVGSKVMSQPNQGMLMSSAAATATLALPSGMAPSNLHHLPAIFSGNVINVTQPQTVLQHTINQQQSNATGLQFSVAGASQASQAARPAQPNRIVQLDGPNDSSDDDEEDDDFRDNEDDHDDNDEDENDAENEYAGEEEEPLNSNDDVSDEEPAELFDVENVVVCQYDKITRSRNKWKFHFKDGIMNLKGKDYVFQKAVGDAEW